MVAAQSCPRSSVTSSTEYSKLRDSGSQTTFNSDCPLELNPYEGLQTTESRIITVLSISFIQFESISVDSRNLIGSLGKFQKQVGVIVDTSTFYAVKWFAK